MHNQKMADQVKQDLSADMVEAYVRLAALIPENVPSLKVAAWVDGESAEMVVHDSATTRMVTIYVSDNGLQFRADRIDENMKESCIGWTATDDIAAITRMFEWVTGKGD